jgi:predicted dehydrogenase
VFRPIRLMTLAPGHFHAALVQKRALHGVHHRAHVYGPLDPDTLAHLARIASFNDRDDSPTGWEIDLRTGPEWLERFTREQPGNTVVLSGRNRQKIDLMRVAVENGLHVVADKPWIVEAADFPKLEEVFRQADLRDALVWDVLTERLEITNWLQRELIRDHELFGTWQTGTPKEPALTLASVHYLKKTVSGRPLVRPWWWFDPDISGESMADVGTHLADLSMWLVAPEQAVDYTTQIQMLSADRCPLLLNEDQFRELTGLPGYPPELQTRVVHEQLYYAGNNSVTFALRGVHVKLATAWEYEAAAGGDMHQSEARGTKATVSVRQEPGKPPEVFVTATGSTDHDAMMRLLREKCIGLQREFAGMWMKDLGAEAQMVIPNNWRSGHEDHFAVVLDEFIRYFKTPRAVPPWERPNALARYYITTKAVEMARGQ